MRRAISLEHVDAQIKRWEKRCTRALNALAKLRGQRSRLERKLKQEVAPVVYESQRHLVAPPPAPERSYYKPKRPGGAYWQRRKKMLTETGRNTAVNDQVS